MTPTAGQILEQLELLAPPELQESYDNIGLLLGHIDLPVNTVFVSLDATASAIRKAEAAGAQLLLTHHPLMFRPIQRITSQEYEGSILLSMARANLCFIAMHTNWDKVQGGTTDALLEALGIQPLPVVTDALYRRGITSQATFSLASFTAHVSDRLHFPARFYGDANRPVQMLYAIAGAGGDEVTDAIQAGADCVLCGEWEHHEILPFVDAGIGVIDAGHAASEWPGVRKLAKGLQKVCDTLQYHVRVILDDFCL